jgi:hypothetical protein
MDCVRKHIGDAMAALHEMEFGYPNRRFMAIGELSHACKESARLYKPFADQVRQAYVQVARSFEDARAVDLEPLLTAADYVAGEGDAYERHLDPSNTKPPCELPTALYAAVEACLRLRLERGEPVPPTRMFPHLCGNWPAPGVRFESLPGQQVDWAQSFPVPSQKQWR